MWFKGALGGALGANPRGASGEYLLQGGCFRGGALGVTPGLPGSYKVWDDLLRGQSRAIRPFLHPQYRNLDYKMVSLIARL